MGQIDDTGASQLPDILRRLRALEFATNQNNMAIGRGGLAVYGGGGITIENGGLSVTGSASIFGTLNADGTINMTGLFIASGEMRLNGTTIATGDFNIDGPLIVDGNTTFNGTLDITGVTNITGDTTVTGKLVTNGPVDINGLTKITGNLEIKGTSTLTGDLNVTGAGKIMVGGITLDPAAAGGALKFSNGTYVAATPNGAQLALGDSAVYVSAAQAGLAYSGNGVFADGSGIRMTALTTTSEPANLYQDPATGKIYRSTA